MSKTTSPKQQRRAAFFLAAVFAFCALCAPRATAQVLPTPQQADSVNRAVAVVITESIQPLVDNLIANNLPLNTDVLTAYIARALRGQSLDMTSQQAAGYIDSAIARFSSRYPDAFTPDSQQLFLERAANTPGALVTPSGLVFIVITEGEGPSPKPTDVVNVRYTARLSNGIILDDTKDTTLTFDLPTEIPGLREGVTMMKPGGTYRLVIPPELAYGAQGIPGVVPANAALDFTVTLP